MHSAKGIAKSDKRTNDTRYETCFVKSRTSNVESRRGGKRPITPWREMKKEQKTALYEAQFQSLAIAMQMVSCFGIQYRLNDLNVSHRPLQQHFFLFFHSTFPASAGLDVRCSMFIFSFLFDQTGHFDGQRLG
jgi:hypothetical protein